MKFSLSTNWCSRTIASGEEIAEIACELGFEELELGFAATSEQCEGIRRRSDLIRVGSLHAFCPVPVSAPCGHPELYRLADFDEENRILARLHIEKSVEFASGIGADCVVLHAGKVGLNGFFGRLDSQKLSETLRKQGGDQDKSPYCRILGKALKRRRSRGRKMLDVFLGELDRLMPSLEKHNVTLALENMPYLEGFPDESEVASILEKFPGSKVKAWFDTGHHQIRFNHGWCGKDAPFRADDVAGMHLNDVVDFNDDHLAPGEGSVDFAAVARTLLPAGHVVFEPSQSVSKESLARSLKSIDAVFKEYSCR